MVLASVMVAQGYSVKKKSDRTGNFVQSDKSTE